MVEWLDFTEDYFKKRNATMIIKLGLVKEFEVSAPMMALESVTINIEVTPDEYIFYKPGLFSTKEIVKIQRKDVTEITNESFDDRAVKTWEKAGLDRYKIADLKRMNVLMRNHNYLTFLKGKSKSVEIYFDNKTSSDVDKILTKLK